MVYFVVMVVDDGSKQMMKIRMSGVMPISLGPQVLNPLHTSQSLWTVLLVVIPSSR